MPAGDLCTLADVVSYLGDPNIGSTSLTSLSFLISAVSAWAQGFTERNLAGVQPYTYTTDGNGGSALFLPAGPVTGITSVTIGGSSVPMSSGSPQYGIVATDCEAVFIGGHFPRGRQNVVVQYQAGYPYLFVPGSPTPGMNDTITLEPADLRWAIVETVALRYRRKDSLGVNSKSLQGQSTSYDNSIAPKDAMAILQRYKKETPW
jgi:hypothetical protein